MSADNKLPGEKPEEDAKSDSKLPGEKPDEKMSEQGENGGHLTENIAEIILQLKKKKAGVKSGFTKAKNKLFRLIEAVERPSRKEVRDGIDQVQAVSAKAIGVMTDLTLTYSKDNQSENVIKTEQEMTLLEQETEEVTAYAQEYLDSRSDATTLSSLGLRGLLNRNSKSKGNRPTSIHGAPQSAGGNATEKVKPIEAQGAAQFARPKRNMAKSAIRREKNKVDVDEKRVSSYSNDAPESHTYALGVDMWKQLKRVSIPVFSGDVRNYESWKAAFLTCIDQAPATAEYKLLQLRQYLSGEALKVIQSLGHSAVAYDIAIERLDRKYGGRRRQVSLQMEEVNNLKSIRQGNSKDLEKFADVLDIAVVNLREADMIEELGNGLLYTTLLKKMTEQLVAQFQRWLYETQRQECVETLREWVLQEAEYQKIASKAIHGVCSKSRKAETKKDSCMFVSAEMQQNRKSRNGDTSCQVCTGQHKLWNCKVFKDMNVSERWNTAKKTKVCFRCLGSNHVGTQCKRMAQCGINGCSKTHNRLLHDSNLEAAQRTNKNPSSTASGLSSTDRSLDLKQENDALSSSATKDKVTERAHTTVQLPESMPIITALRTIPVVLKKGNKRIRVNALLDDASTRSYINSDVAAELGMQGSPQKITVNVLNGHTETFETQPVMFGIESLDGSVDMEISALTTDRVTGDLQVIDWQKLKSMWKHLQNIKFPSIGRRPIIDLLIGIDQLALHMSYEDVCGDRGEPIARKTPLGWTCIGNFNGNEACQNVHFVYYTQNVNGDLSSLVKQFWEVEEIKAPLKLLKPDEKRALSKAEETLCFENGHYQIGIPWKSDKPSLPNNYDMAFKRLLSTEKKLSKDKFTAQAYDNVIAKYLQKGYIRKIPPNESADVVWYVPHFPIVRPARTTTKVCIVFDASAKYKDTSLNDVINPGPKLHSELFDDLLRFRDKPVALVCDISEMFLQIQISPEDRPYHRFLWRSMNTHITPEVYEFSRVVFGNTSSPFLAQFVTQEHARKHELDLPRAAETVIQSTYMDDSMDSVETEEDGVELYGQLTKLWSGASMKARKWLSNSLKILENIPEDDRASEIDISKGHLPTVKALGLVWVAEKDIFTFKAETVPDEVITKRYVLKQVAKLFDPLGFIGPFVVTAKILLQEMWLTGLDWDDYLPQHLKDKIQNWLGQWKDVQNVEIPRCLRHDQTVSLVEVHTFVDASEDAYGAVVYSVHTYLNGEKSSRIIAAKSRVAPLKACSIPRLELMAAVLGLRLVSAVAGVLKIEIDKVTFWSDSMNVLYWIRNNSRTFKPFVANRIGEIQSISNPHQWKHIPSSDNPADLITRGLSISQLAICQLWWSGPSFLTEDTSEWPLNPVDPFDMRNDKELKVKSKKIQVLFTEKKPDPSWRLDPSRFSNWRVLTRISAWVYRFIQNCSSAKKFRTVGELTAEEVEDSESRIIAQAQKEAFPAEYKALLAEKKVPSASKLLQLHPTLDMSGLMRLSGRLGEAECLPHDARFPIILPRKSWITTLVVKHFHESGNHVLGTNQMLSTLSSKYWILSAREAIREWEKECAKCRKMKAKPVTQVMAPLPSIRVKASMRAFSHTGVDYAGPFLTVQGRGKASRKRYLCLFTCLTTRAVHLEMAYSMDTDAFLNAFYRMVNRRGLPDDVISDNGTNFVGAIKELKELLKAIDKDAIHRSLANRGIKWHFNPPNAPHFGGVFETMIKAAKRAIFAILENCDVTDEELVTAFTGAEALINSRPLTYQSDHPQDLSPLAPNHFLHGKIGGFFAPDSVDSTDFHPKKRWRRVQELVRHVWRRWMREWLPTLNVRKKWNRTSKDLSINDIVLVISQDTPRGHWKLGNIIKTYPGKDGHVRVVDVQIGKSVLTRPVNRICPLEWTSDGQDSQHPTASTGSTIQQDSQRQED